MKIQTSRIEDKKPFNVTRVEGTCNKGTGVFGGGCTYSDSSDESIIWFADGGPFQQNCKYVDIILSDDELVELRNMIDRLIEFRKSTPVREPAVPKTTFKTVQFDVSRK